MTRLTAPLSAACPAQRQKSAFCNYFIRLYFDGGAASANQGVAPPSSLQAIAKFSQMLTESSATSAVSALRSIRLPANRSGYRPEVSYRFEHRKDLGTVGSGSRARQPELFERSGGAVGILLAEQCRGLDRVSAPATQR
jgi:hypothetical protein